MNEDLLNLFGSFSEISLDCIEKQNEEIEQLQQENKQLKERLERIDNYLDKNYTVENQYWFDHIQDIVKDR